MDRVTALALTAARELLTEPVAAPDDTAVVLATSGGVQGMRDFTHGSLLAARPFYVDPAVIPSGLMNCAASQTAIRHHLRGPNVTIATGRVGALQALSYATRLLRANRAGQVVVGAVEECTPTRARLEHPARPALLGEGCVLFLLTPPPDTTSPSPPVELLGIHSTVLPPDDLRAGIRRCLLDTLDAHSLHPDDVSTASLSQPGGSLAHHERDAVASVLGTTALDNAPTIPGIGETASVTAAFQLAALLSAPTPPPDRATSAIDAVITVDPGGGVACALLKTHHRT